MENQNMEQPYHMVTGENAWSRTSSIELFDVAPGDNKEMRIILKTGHFDMCALVPVSCPAS